MTKYDLLAEIDEADLTTGLFLPKLKIEGRLVRKIVFPYIIRKYDLLLGEF